MLLPWQQTRLLPRRARSSRDRLYYYRCLLGQEDYLMDKTNTAHGLEKVVKKGKG